jgi:hypothetical protein
MRRANYAVGWDKTRLQGRLSELRHEDMVKKATLLCVIKVDAFVLLFAQLE